MMGRFADDGISCSYCNIFREESLTRVGSLLRLRRCKQGRIARPISGCGSAARVHLWEFSVSTVTCKFETFLEISWDSSRFQTYHSKKGGEKWCIFDKVSNTRVLGACPWEVDFFRLHSALSATCSIRLGTPGMHTARWTHVDDAVLEVLVQVLLGSNLQKHS